MGNAFHSSASSVKIELDHPEGEREDQPLPAGSLLRGKVVVEIAGRRPLHISTGTKNADAASSCIQLRLYGKEKVCMDRRKAVHAKGSGAGCNGHDHPRRPRKHAERPFLDVRLQWSKFPNVQQEQQPDGTTTRMLVPPGMYAFPFQVQLPRQLPSTTYHPIHRNGSRMKHGCRIQYKLHASVIDPSSSSGTPPRTSTIPMTRSALSDTQYVWVAAAAMQNSRRHKVPCFLAPTCTPIPGVFQSGHLLYGAAVEDCAVPQGGEIRLHIACRNDSPTDVTRVTIRVLEQVSWGTSSAAAVDNGNAVATSATTTGVSSSSLQQTDYLPVATVQNVKGLPGVEKEAKSMWKAAMDSWMGVENSPLLLREMHRDLTNGRNLVTLPVPAQVRASFTGQLVQVQHVIRIDFVTAGVLFAAGKSPHLEIPISVLSTTQPAELPPGFRKGAGIPYCIQAPADATVTSSSGSCQIHPAATSSLVPATTGHVEELSPPVAAALPPPSNPSMRRQRPNVPLVSSGPSRPEPATVSPTIMAHTGLGTKSSLQSYHKASTKESSTEEEKPSSSLAFPSLLSRPFSLFSKQQQQQPEKPPQQLPASAPPPEARDDENNEDPRPALAPALPVPGFEPIGRKSNNHIPSVAIASAPLELPPSATMMQVGGESVLKKRRGRRRQQPLPEPLPAPLALPEAPSISLATLRHDMHYAINCYDLVSAKLLEPSWRPFFRSLSPSDYGSILSYVDVAIDQPRVAVLLAPHIGKGDLDSRFVASALRHAQSPHKANMAQRLLPLMRQTTAADHAMIRAELNEWEQTVVYASLPASASNEKQHRLVGAL